MGRLGIWVATGVAGALVLVVGTAAVVVSRQDDGAAHHPSSVMMGGTVSVPAGDEYAYLSHMVAHHREAVVAAGQLARSERPAMRALGARIVSSQSDQVAQMVAWLQDWYPSRPTTAADYQPQMRDLSRLDGDERDRAFLADMVPHHMMAVMMSQRLLAAGTTEHDQVATLARTISAEQRAEIVTMTRWLRTWFGQSANGMPGPMMGW